MSAKHKNKNSNGFGKLVNELSDELREKSKAHLLVVVAVKNKHQVVVHGSGDGSPEDVDALKTGRMRMKTKINDRASMINAMVTSAIPGIATAVGAFQTIRDTEQLPDEAKHHLQLATDHLEMANLLIAKFTCDMEPGQEGTKKIEKVRDEMQKDVDKLKKEMKIEPKGRKIEVE